VGFFLPKTTNQQSSLPTVNRPSSIVQMPAIRKPIDTSSLPHSGLVDIMADITEKEQPWAARAEQIFEELRLQAALNRPHSMVTLLS
jgi:hypothetical protein